MLHTLFSFGIHLLDIFIYHEDFVFVCKLKILIFSLRINLPLYSSQPDRAGCWYWCLNCRLGKDNLTQHDEVQENKALHSASMNLMRIFGKHIIMDTFSVICLSRKGCIPFMLHTALWCCKLRSGRNSLLNSGNTTHYTQGMTGSQPSPEVPV